MPDSPQEPLTVDDIDSSSDGVPADNSDVIVSPNDAMSRLAIVAAEKDELLVENERLRLKAKTTEILDDLIKPYARSTFWFMVSYCVFVGLFLLIYAWGGFKKDIPETVLNFMVGSTATTVIGLVGMVLTGVFIGARPK